jgi:digeranylgeranylglycerophospholipid reductase
MTIECDVLVVGGGPAGCSAARAAAKQGAKTILIEEHKEIGVPVQCAEGIGKYLIPFLPFKIPKEQLIWEIKGMTFWADDILIERNGGIWSGYTINRAEWDKWLASLAEKEGAQVKTNSKLIGLDFDDNYFVKKAIVKCKDKKIEIKPKIVIAADGVESSVVNILGVNNRTSEAYGEVKSFEMKNIDLRYPYHDQLFLGDFAPGAYAYVFPISKDRANIGIGKIRDSKENIDELYNKFLDLSVIKSQIGKSNKIIEKGGFAPLKYSTDEIIYGNVILTGDAANQNFKPFIEGNLPAIICGDIAGKISIDGIKNIDSLKNYRKLVTKRLGPMLKGSDEILEILLKIHGLKYEDLLYFLVFSNICPLNTVRNLFDANKDEITDIIKSWNNSQLKQFKTRTMEKFYLLILSILRNTRRV